MDDQPEGPEQRFPRDGRVWFRMLTDLLDDPRFDSADWVLGAYVRLLAMLKRQRSRDGQLWLSDQGLGKAMGRRKIDAAQKRLRYLVDIELISAAFHADSTLILIAKWPKIQGHRKTKNADIEREREKKKRAASPKSKTSIKKSSEGSEDWLLRIISKEPGTPEEKRAWLERELPLLIEFAERDYPDDPKRRNRELRSRVFRHWRQHLKTNGQAGSQSDTDRMNAATRRSLRRIEAQKKERDALYTETT